MAVKVYCKGPLCHIWVTTCFHPRYNFPNGKGNFASFQHIVHNCLQRIFLVEKGHLIKHWMQRAAEPAMQNSQVYYCCGTKCTSCNQSWMGMWWIYHCLVFLSAYLSCDMMLTKVEWKDKVNMLKLVNEIDCSKIVVFLPIVGCT